MHKGILKYPYPYKAWVSLANDPDNTVISDWEELDEFIWNELQLPFGDSLFVRSFNANLPDQVSLEKYPHIGTSHYHDIIHTWGDYMHARKRGFDREDAKEAIHKLNQLGISPKVWIDHASFTGNFIHGTSKGAQNKLVDSSGHEYTNYVYTLDLAHKMGVRYVWNGEVTPVVGQDRDLSVVEASSTLRALAKRLLRRDSDNRQYYPKQFPDGSWLYCFRRYGTWQDADIDGLGKLISEERLNDLILNNGSAIVYTHLGKRHPSGSGRKQHIPNSTRNGLRNIRARFEAKELMASPVSEMLDYMVIRDGIRVRSNQSIDFHSDKIRFPEMQLSDLKGKTFSFQSRLVGSSIQQILLDGISVEHQLVDHGNGIVSITF